MLSVGPLKGLDFISPTLSKVSDLHHPHQYNEQSVGLMEDLSEMFTLATWPEVNGLSKFPWDHHSGAAALNSAPHPHYSPHDVFTGAAQANMQQQGLCDPSMHSSSDISLASDANISASHAHLISRGVQEAAALNALRRIQEGSCRALGLTSSSSGGSSSSDIAASIIRSRSSAPLLPTWHQAYMGGVSSPCPLGLGPVKAEALMLQADGSLCGRTQDDNAQARQNEGMFIPICGAQAQQPRAAGQQPHAQVQVSHGISTPSYSSHTGIGQPQGAAAVVAGTARPRVRARRGQATDPHSIAERLRRERIADRMKALQELVPNANKTDKASMLDEIIEYVRFLQLQVKILSMSRLTGTGAVTPLVTDMSGEGLFDFGTTALIRGSGAMSSSQDNTLATERQVARMMEESMGSALQFLQSKGLCLMPISLATAMSSNINARPATGSSHGKAEASSSSIRAPSSAGIALSVHCTSDMVTDEVSSATNASIRHSRDTMMQHNAAAPNVLKSTIKPLTNITKIN